MERIISFNSIELMWLFIIQPRPNVGDLDDLTIISVPSANAHDPGTAIDRFLGTPQELDDPSFARQRFEFIDLLLFTLEDTNNLSPNGSVLMNMMSDAGGVERAERNLLLDPEFRKRVKELMTTDPVTGIFGAANRVFALYNDRGTRRRTSYYRTKELVKHNDIRKLRFLWEDYCQELHRDYTVGDLQGMAQALGIENPRPNKEWLCTEIGTRLVVAKTGMHTEQLQQILKGPGYTEDD